jgi:hypothetical protein
MEKINHQPNEIMKNKEWVTMGITLVSVALTMAQPTDVIRERTPLPPEEDVLIERDVATALSEHRAQLALAADQVAEAKAQAGAQRKLLLAQAGGGGGFGREFGLATHQRSPRALVIPKEASDAKSLGEVEEDLGVMAHILDKAVSSGDKSARAMGIAVFSKFPGAAAAPQNLYVEGHGAIFLLDVNYPLLPPPAKEDKEEAKEPVNNEWEEARREMARPGKGQPGDNPFEIFEERYGGDAWNVKLPSAEYDADKVEDLKKDLIGALKNAANIRRLKSDETVTVVVTGAEAGVVTKSFKSTSGKPGSSKTERVVVAKSLAGERARVNDSAKLIIRARKADAEAFQNGKLDFDAFRKKATVLIY